MRYRSRRKTRALSIFLLCIIFSLVVVFYKNKSIEQGKSNPGEGIFASLTLPLQRKVNKLAEKVTFISSLRKSKETIEENRKLKEEIGKLTRENQILKEAFEENKQFKSLLDLKNTLQMDTLPALVIGREPNSWFKSITIDKGYIEGISKNMIVLDDRGLIGKVAVVSPHKSKVMLITDSESAVPATIRETRDNGIVYGTGNTCEMKYITSDSEIKTGYTVITSGMGMIYPKGLVIGKIINIYPSNDKLFQTAEIALSVKIGALENILIIKPEDPLIENSRGGI
ncbi:MAG TPA: rod shape-determining protein MreC [Candidatus Eremiobacteraeota bacterium]|nr:MAG: Cell shape-determining protein MreC precursor [bacterium ADurb.Bin363]HPZ07931.1 rod shape-determining protein MreC [Candidatus Eremiobacteraeota bacterium]